MTAAGEERYPIIQALRAIAVTSVVGYHAGLSFLPGGFVGVDVFFAISGFLIINHIIAEHHRGVFTFASFYAKRAIRILPPYYIVIIASVIIGDYVLVFDEEVERFGQEVVWSSLMLANYLFLGQQGYFDIAAETKPLLHLWTLAVEEQFYLVVPLIISGACILARRLPPKARGTVGWALALLAMLVLFFFCIRLSVSVPKRSESFQRVVILVGLLRFDGDHDALDRNHSPPL